MFKLVCLLVVFGYASSATLSNCNGNAPVQVTLQSLADPVSLIAGAKIPLKFKLDIKGAVPASSKVHIKVYKSAFWTWIKVPCIRNLGSCTYDITCQKLKDRLGASLVCPPPAGSYDIARTLTVPDIRVPSFLANGQYKIVFEMKTSNDVTTLACGTIKVGVSL